MVNDGLVSMLKECGSWAGVIENIGSNVEKSDRMDLYIDVLNEVSDDPDTYNSVRSAMKTVNAEIRQERDKLRDMAYTDALTGLNNRRQFDESIDEVVNGDNCSANTSLVYFDIDHFKRFNDTFGHSAGDYVLNKLGGIIKDTSRVLDNPCRYGGEEFAVILPATDGSGAYAAAEKLRKVVESEAWEYGGVDLGKVRISLGVSCVRDGDTAKTLVDRADSALYEAKENGRNRTVLYQDKE